MDLDGLWFIRPCAEGGRHDFWCGRVRGRLPCGRYVVELHGVLGFKGLRVWEVDESWWFFDYVEAWQLSIEEWARAG